MLKYTVEVSGMTWGMCESHVNDAVRKAMKVKKVSSSHSKKETVIVAEQEIDENALRNAIKNAGYDVGSISQSPCKSFLGFTF